MVSDNGGMYDCKVNSRDLCHLDVMLDSCVAMIRKLMRASQKGPYPPHIVALYGVREGEERERERERERSTGQMCKSLEAEGSERRESNCATESFKAQGSSDPWAQTLSNF